MRFKRTFTSDRCPDPFAGIEFVRRESRIISMDGSDVREPVVVVAPEAWSKRAVDILADKYMRRAGVPSATERVAEEGVPEWLRPSVPANGAVFGRESDARMVFLRLAGCWTYHAWKGGYFRDGPGVAASEESARAFHDEVCAMLALQVAAPNSPQWFNTGLHWAYGIVGDPCGQWRIVRGTTEVVECKDGYSAPQAHACYIQSVEDNLLGDGGIMSLWEREARVFKYGGGTGSNFSNLRAKGEALSGGGTSSGVLSWLRIGDAGAGAIKSGGTTRRAAKMVILDIDHPDIEEFVDWKVNEEQKVAALAAGSRAMALHVAAVQAAVMGGDEVAADRAAAVARKAGVLEAVIQRAVVMAREGHELKVPVHTLDFEGTAYTTVSGQNANNSVGITDDFMLAVEADGDWPLYGRLELDAAQREGREPKPCKVVRARALWEKISYATWACADPGLFFRDTINRWNPCSADGSINASNPCGEYLFLDDTGCNLASLNLLKFWAGPRNRFAFNFEKFAAATAVWTAVLDVTVDMASYPSKKIAERSSQYRTLGLGYANLGSLLMRMGLPYDSDEGRAVAASMTAFMHFTSTITSAAIADCLHPYPRYKENAKRAFEVVGAHVRHFHGGDGATPAYHLAFIGNADIAPIISEAWAAADEALLAVERHGMRNAQLTLCAPTGTIGLLMDCDTTGIEPDFSLVKWKTLAGGGYFKIVSQAIPDALKSLGYSPGEVADIVAYAVGRRTMTGSEHAEKLIRHLGRAEFDRINSEVEKVGTADLRTLIPSLDEALGLDAAAEMDRYVSGAGTVEGAPHLKPEHLPVFDCANKCGQYGTRVIPPEGHLRMMAAAQPYLSGAISKTINMPSDVTIGQVGEYGVMAWKLGLKDVAMYRDGSKMSQVLSSAPSGAVNVVVSDDPPATMGVRVVYRDRSQRKPLPSRRRGYTQKVKIGGHQSLFLRTGEYDDGSLGEIFVDMSQQGTMARSFANAFAIAVSIGLQYGVPLEEFIDAFVGMRFEPHGMVSGHRGIKMASSIIDMIFRDLAIEYLGRSELANIPDPEDDSHDTAPAEAPSVAQEASGRPREGSGLRAARKKPEATPGPSHGRGYEGDPCRVCHAMTMVRSGNCFRCDTCGSTTGCG